MRASPHCVAFIKRFEGFSATPYKCSAGVYTIGYGTTKGITKDTPPVTKEQADEMFIRDLIKFENSVNNLIKHPLKQNQFDSLVSFVYNLGGGALQRSTLRQKINRGDINGASAEFMKWTKAGGRVIMGLVTRREAEMKLFIGG